MIAHRRYFLILSAVYGVIWIALAIDPHDRSDWALENVMVAVANRKGPTCFRRT